MDGFSLDIKSEQIAKLKALFPEIFSEEKIDWERLRATLGEDTFISNERYVLNWAGKSDAFKTLQTGTTATLAPARDESINFDTTDNVFIEGENLEVLKVLQKAYFGKIKCIIIDPPYNTGNDSFIYPDKFSETKEEYMRRVGDKDAEGYLMKEGLFRKNSKENGQYHSNWLSMMYPRLFLARNLLRDDGVIFVHIDDNEVHNLRLLMNEIFGEENFVASIIWQKKYAPQNDTRWFTDLHDYIILLAKNKENWRPTLLPRDEKQNQYYKFDDFDGKGKWRTDNILVKSYTANRVFPIINPNTKKEYLPPKGRCWRYSQETIDLMLKENRIYFGKEGIGAPQVKRYLNEVKDGVTPLTLWLRTEVGDNQDAKYEINSYFDIPTFDTPKPTTLIKRMIQLSTKVDENNIVFDFFSGSGTTAHAVLDLNKEDGGKRKFLLVQIPEQLEKSTEAFKAGYKTIADIGKERIRRVIKKIEEERKPSDQPKLIEEQLPELDLGFKVFKLKPSNFKQWQSKAENAEDLQTAIEEFIDPVKPEAEEENMLFELLLKSGYDFNSKIETKTIDESRYFLININELVLQLSGKPEAVINDILSIKPKKVIMLDRLFENNDQLKTNTFLQFKDAGVDFRTV